MSWPIGYSAYFLVPKAAAIGFFIGVCSVAILFATAHLFPRHFFLQRAIPGSISKTFWKGQLWESYRRSLEKRKSLVTSIFNDTWALIVLLVYALSATEAAIACGVLGSAAAVSSIILVQYIQEKEWFIQSKK